MHTARLDGVQHRPEVVDAAATLLEVEHGRDGLVAELVDEQVSLPVRVTLADVVIASKDQADFARPVTSTRPVGVPEGRALTDFRPHEVKSLGLDPVQVHHAVVVADVGAEDRPGRWFQCTG